MKTVILRYILKLNIPEAVNIEYANFDLPVVYPNEAELDKIKEILRIILIMKGFTVFDGPFEVENFAAKWDSLMKEMPEKKKTTQLLSIEGDFRYNEVYAADEIESWLEQIKVEMFVRDLRYGVSNLVGGIKALIENHQLPEEVNYSFLDTEKFDTEWNEGRYVIFNKNAFNHWLNRMKVIVKQIEEFIE